MGEIWNAMKTCPRAMQNPSEEHEETEIRRGAHWCLAQEAERPVDPLMLMTFSTRAHKAAYQGLALTVYSVLLRRPGSRVVMQLFQ